MTIKTTIRIDKDLLKEAQHRCIDDDLTFQQLIDKALREYLKKPPGQKGAKK